MLFGLLRGAALALLVSTLVYLAVSAYVRSLRRQKLEQDWDVAYRPGENPEGRAEFIARGMRAFRKSLAYRLLWLIYAVPLAFAVVTVWVMNHQ
ncbi:hypothetical protein [Phaeovulum vinaykumarii]|uniref:Uncharacterized protein n=1 Tax=Phaeovulum vinaykumarii TaxID=407234 RepID=A0A1N7K2B4_9RHOB|nr:hypothetical protein [Phaeovulum vinaykumarii]SIS55574.1 hypothetical protein SAMN05421795_101541 [Phaeovulum vinaykumarii]SOB92441.1 hypothetical protein SAMN05878426_101539 [Phaeovulum vinaykumarii]